MIELKNVSKRFSETPCLDSISLVFPPGTTHAILGGSGCGKSTLLRIIVGILEPDQGEVLIDGMRMNSRTQPELAQRMGYVIQEGGLFPHLTCWGNIALKASLIGWSGDRIRSRILELAQMMGLGESLLRRCPRDLSGGQRQRISLMRALMLDPPILLLDEPLGALDPIVRRTLQIQIRDLFARLRKTVILVTHDVGEASFLAENLILLDRGRIIQQGSFQELLQFPADPFVTEFIHAQRPLGELRLVA